MRLVGTCQVLAGVEFSFVDQRGFKGLNRVGTGIYELQFDTNFAASEVNCTASPASALAGVTTTYGSIGLVAVDNPPTGTTVTVHVVDPEGAPIDLDFQLIAVGLN